ncbi:MAG: hypothetical protein KF774_09345 [Planctomyces sp.]|nr:hypothetical protein [Planctomyces sp.]
MGAAKRSRERSADEGLPVMLVSAGVAAVLALLLWGVACAMYDNAQGYRWVMEASEGTESVRLRRSSGIAMLVSGVIVFVKNSVMYVPELFSVIGFVFRERFWFVIVSAILLGGVALAGWQLQRMETAMRSGNPFSRSGRTSRRG